MIKKGGHIYIIGGGIAGLAAAVFAIRDGKSFGPKIHIFEEGTDEATQLGSNSFGGALDATEVIKRGFLMRGGRMFDEKYVCTYDMLSAIPSYDDKRISAAEDIFRFTNESGWYSTARLLDTNGKILNLKSMGFDWNDRLALLHLLLTSEVNLSRKRIDEVLPDHFFDTNFWQIWSTMFSFQPWHSAIEMKRYLLRFIHLFPRIASLSCIFHTRYNQYHSIVVPTIDWLKEQGVDFQKGSRIIDLEFSETRDDGSYRVTSLKKLTHTEATTSEIEVGADDCVLFTNGSMTDSATIGDWDRPALPNKDIGGAWELWQTLAKKRQNAFGNPEVFIGSVAKSKWVSFTATTKSQKLAEHICKLTSRKFGRDGLITFKRSGWCITIHPHFAPVYPGHNGNEEFVLWGYGLRPDDTGDFINKKMSDCSGKELLEETLRHLRVDDETFAEVMDKGKSTSIPCLMPFVTSQFMPRALGDRSPLRPVGAENLAFMGQFSETEKDVVFTVEYSVRTAKMAVASLIDEGIEIEPVYEGFRNLRHLLVAIWISIQPSWWPLKPS